MADNVAITAGTGTTIAADDIGGGVLVQRAKMTWGPDGTANDTDVATGKPLPVQVRSATGLIPLGEPTDAKSTSTDTTSVSGISIWKQISASLQLLVFGAGTAAAAQRTTLASDDPAVAALGATSGAAVITDATGTIQQYLRGLIKQWIAGTLVIGTGANVIGQVTGAAATVTSSVTRPNDTTAYAANDAWANATSLPATLTFTSCFRASGKSALLTDMVVTSSANQATALQGELWLFDTAPTAVNDNAAFALGSDSEFNTVVAKIPFSIDSVGTVTAGAGGNAGCFVTGINALLTGVASANLTGLIKVINAYTPVANEVLTFRLKFVGVD